MTEYDVHLYLTFRVKMPKVIAVNKEAAIESALETLDPGSLPTMSTGGRVFEYSDEVVAALVDIVGDDDFSHSMSLVPVPMDQDPWICDNCGKEAQWLVEWHGDPLLGVEYHCPFCWNGNGEQL